MNNIYAKTLPIKTAALVTVLQREKPSFLGNFYLSGGTALSLQLGHRESEDLDFFNQNNFEPTKLQTELEKIGHLESLEIAEGTLNAFLMGVKLQFLAYPYPLLEKFVDFQDLKLSSVLDIACTKLHTISMRGSKKDFVDLFFILQQFTLEDLFEKLSQKYTQANFNQTHILKSLLYFSDAEKQPMPRMHQDVSWEDVKARVSEKVKGLEI